MIASFEAFTESVIEALEGNENETVNIQADLKGIKNLSTSHVMIAKNAKDRDRGIASNCDSDKQIALLDRQDKHFS